MGNSIFDLFDFSELAKKLEDLKTLATDKYNDFVNNNVKKYDLNTQEGYEAFIKEAADIRTELLKSDSIFANKLIDLLDKMVEKAMNEHIKQKTNDINANKKITIEKVDNTPETINDLVQTEVARNKNENHGKINTGKKEYVAPEVKESSINWPSEKLTPKQKRNVWKLVDEYVDTMIVPYLDEDFDEDVVDDMSSGLFEFAAWILTKEE